MAAGITGLGKMAKISLSVPFRTGAARCLRRAALAATIGLVSLPATAQIVVVPLDPVDSNEVVPGDSGGAIQTLPDPTQPQPDGTLPRLDVPEDGIVLDDGTVLGPVEMPPAPGSMVGDEVQTVQEAQVAKGTGAVLKGLDKVAGTVRDIRLASGQTASLGWLKVTLGECRYPVDNPSGDAYAWVEVRDKTGEAPIFKGWMIASSPALDALDHPRFDVWVKTCTTN